MPIYSKCPVPLDQRPLNEYTELCSSWFFKIPNQSKKDYVKSIFFSWLIFFPFCLVIENESVNLKEHLLKLLLVSSFTALFLPICILIRQWLGWNYILKRLKSENIEYEETGWYDGKKWDKPVEWREQDMLVANYQVKPTIKKITNSIIILSIPILLFLGTTIFI